jgi:hypothetical protein
MKFSQDDSRIVRAICLCAILGAAVMCCPAGGAAADWIYAPTVYSHHPDTGEPLGKIAEPPPQYLIPSPDYVRSGYRQFRSSIRTPLSADNMHITEEWGREVRPYGEWQRPFRPYSTPYPNWAPPFYGMNQFFRGYPLGVGPGFPGPGGPGPGLPGPGMPPVP